MRENFDYFYMYMLADDSTAGKVKSTEKARTVCTTERSGKFSLFTKALGAARQVTTTVYASAMLLFELKAMLYYCKTNLCVALLVNTGHNKRAFERKLEKVWGTRNFKSWGLEKFPGQKNEMIACLVKCHEFEGKNGEMKRVKVSKQGRCSFSVDDVLKHGGKSYIYLTLEIPPRRADLQLQFIVASRNMKRSEAQTYSMLPEYQELDSGSSTCVFVTVILICVQRIVFYLATHQIYLPLQAIAQRSDYSWS